MSRAPKTVSTEDLARMLKEDADEYLSGEEIAERLGVSRTAVWNHIQELRELGYDIEAVPHRGYRLSGLPERLLPDEIRDGLRAKRFGKRITVYEKLDSTNDTAMQAAQSGAPEGTVIFAELQSKGRGRLGRQWHSPRGKGLWFSIVLRPDLPMSSTPRITLAAAVGAAKALRELTGLLVQIKWPNDLFLEGKKICGILTEIETDLESIRYAVLGLGINVNLDKEDFPPELRTKATSLQCAMGGKALDRNEIARVLLEHLEEAYDTLLAGDFEGISKEWSSMSATTGKWVDVMMHNTRFEGIAEGVDANGCLIVRKENGMVEHIISGDVLLKD